MSSGEKKAFVQQNSTASILNNKLNVANNQNWNLAPLNAKLPFEIKLETIEEYYKAHFSNQEHYNYLCVEEDESVFVVCVLGRASPGTFPPKRRCLKIHDKGSLEFYCVVTEGMDPLHKRILNHLKLIISCKTLYPLLDQQISAFSSDLCIFEQTFSPKIQSLNLGIICCKKGQSSPLEMVQMSKDELGPDFTKFMDSIGSEMKAENDKCPAIQKVFPCYHTSFKQIDVIYNVAPFLSPEDNKICLSSVGLIVFMMSDSEEFNMAELLTTFTNLQMIAIVKPIKRPKDEYLFKVAFLSDPKLRHFSPDLPKEILEPELLKDFLLSKFHNGYLVYQTEKSDYADGRKKVLNNFAMLYPFIKKKKEKKKEEGDNSTMSGWLLKKHVSCYFMLKDEHLYWFKEKMTTNNPEFSNLVRGSLDIRTTFVTNPAPNTLKVGNYVLKSDDTQLIQKWYQLLKQVSNQIQREGWLTFKGKKYFFQLKNDTLVWYHKDPNLKKNLKKHIPSSAPIKLPGAKVQLSKSSIIINPKDDPNTFILEAKDEEMASSWFTLIEAYTENELELQKIDSSTSVSSDMKKDTTPATARIKAHAERVERTNSEKSTPLDKSSTEKGGQPSDRLPSTGDKTPLPADKLPVANDKGASNDKIPITITNEKQTLNQPSSEKINIEAQTSKTPKASKLSTSLVTESLQSSDNSTPKVKSNDSSPRYSSAPRKTLNLDLLDNKRTDAPRASIVAEKLAMFSEPNDSLEKTRPRPSVARSKSRPESPRSKIQKPVSARKPAEEIVHVLPEPKTHRDLKSFPDIKSSPDLGKLPHPQATDKMSPSKVVTHVTRNSDIVVAKDKHLFVPVSTKSPTMAELQSWNEEDTYNWLVNTLKIREQHGQIMKNKGFNGEKLLQVQTADELGVPIVSARVILTEISTIKTGIKF